MIIEDNLNDISHNDEEIPEIDLPDKKQKQQTNKQKIKVLSKIMRENESIKKVIEIDKKQFRTAAIVFSSGVGLLILALALYIVKMQFAANSLSWLQTLAAAVFIAGGLCALIGFWQNKKRLKTRFNNFISAVENFSWPTIYNKGIEIFFEKWSLKVTDVEVVAHGYISKDQSVATNALVCDFQNTKLYYSIRSEIFSYETNNKITYKTFVSEFLNTKSDEFKFQSEIKLVKKRKKNKPTFVSESVLFNEKFDVFAESEFDATKIFRPALIEKFFDLQIYPEFDAMVLKDQDIKTYTKWETKGNFPWVEIANWEANPRIETYLDNVSAKVLDDLVGLSNILNYSAPFFSK